MLTPYLNLITDFGDSAVTVTFAAITSAYLLVHKQKRAVLAIILALCLTAFLITVGKVILYSRCHPSADALFDLRSPSGHSALSIAVYGTFAAIIASSQSGWRRFAPYVCIAAFVLLIAASRVLLGVHTISDVIVGAGVGASVSACIWYFLLRGEVIQCRWLLFCLMAVVIITALNGLHFPAETIIDYFSALIRKHVAKCE